MAAKLGFTNVDRFTGGHDEWTMAGRFLEVRTGASVSDLLDDGAQAVDFRLPAEFDAAHLPGAVNSQALLVPTDPFGSVGSALQTDTVLLYGSGGGVADEYVAAVVLEAVGFTKLYYYVGGWANWNVSTD